MAISDLYTLIVLQNILRDMIEEGTSPTSSAILEQLENYLESHSLSEPVFLSSNYEVDWAEESSASKHNNTVKDIHQDLTALYSSLLDISDQAIKRFDRWKGKAKILESRLETLVERISNLLLVETDTSGFLSYIQEKFNNTSNIDLTETTARIDLQHGHISMGTSNSNPTKVFFANSIQEDDIEFTVLTKDSLTSTIAGARSKLKNAFDTATNFWQEIIYTSKQVSVSVELKIKLGDNPIEISRIDVDLHSSNGNSSVRVLPLYSTDGYNWNQVSSKNYVLYILDKATFQFPTIEAKYLKFIMTKEGPDIIRKSTYGYEFGVDEIAFFKESIDTTTTSGQVFISNPLFISNPSNGEVQGFTKSTLEICESIDTDNGTNIDYYIAASNDSSHPVVDAQWIPIDPINRNNPTKPTLVNFGQVNRVSISGITISYDPLETNTSFVNPKKTYSLVTSVTGTTPTTVTATASGQRYTFLNPEDMILDLALSTDLNIADSSIELWRNVSTIGSTILVRGYSNGWGYDGIYYSTTVYVGSSAGVEINFGPKGIIIDEVFKSGKVSISSGTHLIKVHKDNWKYVDDSSVTNLTTLKAADSLYPYNHRYLIEGFNYPGAWSTSEEKIYLGFDIVAQYKMKQVSIFDILHNTQNIDLTRFATDLDTEDTGRALSSGTNTNPSNVFVLKSDTSKADFINEKFILRFRSANTRYKYLRLRAILKSTSTEISPYLAGYKIKVGD